jgi:hypothetical protein
MEHQGNRMRPRNGLKPACVMGIVLAALTMPAHAVDRLTLRIAQIGGGSWQAQDAQIEIDLASSSAEIRLRQARFPEPLGELKALLIRCPQLVATDAEISCAKAAFHLDSAWLAKPDFSGSFRFLQESGELTFDVHDARLGGGKLDLRARYGADAWQLGVNADALMLNASQGKLASDKLSFKAEGKFQPVGDDWMFEVTAEAASGQLYYEPVFVDFAAAPAKAKLHGKWEGKASRVAIVALDFKQPGVLQVQGTLGLATSPAFAIETAGLDIAEARLPALYNSYVQPFLIGTAVDSLETLGSISGRLELKDSKPVLLDLRLADVHFDDKKKRYALYGLDGTVDWRMDPGAPGVTELDWNGGSAYKINFGASGLKLRNTGRDVVLAEPARIPLLDGALLVRRAEFGNIGAGMNVAFEGDIEPLNVQKLCEALGWPVFGGKLAGRIPAVEYRDGNFVVAGTLSADVFGGRVAVDRLNLEQPFGLLPKLSADMTIRSIDLEQATSAFSFGRIEGRLDGDVKNLRLVRWNPVAFDGRLYTPANDKSRHRISQRAIENISDLGGSGAAGVLSRGFLRFFEDFAYDRLALGCRLQDGVCQMSGLEPNPKGGYYIVKGKLIPRIDVVGFAERVNWDAFVEQLKSIAEGEGPVIK